MLAVRVDLTIVKRRSAWLWAAVLLACLIDLTHIRSCISLFTSIIFRYNFKPNAKTSSIIDKRYTFDPPINGVVLWLHML